MKTGKRVLVLLMCLLFALTVLPTLAAADSAVQLNYELTSDGAAKVKGNIGDVITVTLRLCRADGEDGNYQIRALQSEIIYDQDFFEYVEDSAQVVKSGGFALFQTRTDGTNIIKASYLSEYGGDFSDGEIFCTFQLRIIASGEGYVMCDADRSMAYGSDGEEFFVSTGSGLTVTCKAPGVTGAKRVLLILVLVLVVVALALSILALILPPRAEDEEQRKKLLRIILLASCAVLAVTAVLCVILLVLLL